MSEQASYDAYKARIMVAGCGGGGCNTVNRLTELGVKGAQIIAMNTDAKHLSVTNADKKILLGKELTRGLGAGGYPDVGKRATEESKEQIKESFSGCDLLFATCGLGGGTGTGSISVVSKIAKEMGAIVIAPVTFPFRMEGTRIGKAEDGLMNLRDYADTVIIIENQKLLQLAGQRPLKEAFAVADDLIASMIKGVTELISEPSLVNLDYADVRSIMHSGGVATIGVGESDTKNKAREAIEMALNHPLLDVDYQGASGALIQVIGGEDLTLDEITEIGETVSNKMSPDATVMWGARLAPDMKGKVKVITIITGVTSPYILGTHKEEEKSLQKKVNSEFTRMGIRTFA